MAVVVAIAATAAVITVAPVVGAAPAYASTTDVVTFTSDAFTAGGGESVIGRDEITCRITVDDPHVVEDGTDMLVISYGTTHCGRAIAEISQDQSLFLNTVTVDTDERTLWDVATLPTVVYTVCTAGFYSSVAEAELFAPTGYYPQISTIVATSQLVAIGASQCIGPNNGGGGGGDPNCPIACAVKNGGVHQGSMARLDTVGEPARVRG